MYRIPEKKRIYSLSGELPIDETLHLQGIESGDKICLKWEIEDLSLHVINSRKLNVKALVMFKASVDELAQIGLPTELKRTSGCIGQGKRHTGAWAWCT